MPIAEFSPTKSYDLPQFGIAGYLMPNPSKSHFYKPHVFKIVESTKKEKDSYLTDAVKAKAFLPPPTQYQPEQDKTAMLFKQNLSIYKTKRTTFCDELTKRAKHGPPSVGTYTINDGMHPDRIKGSYKSSVEKSNSVIDDAVYHSMHVPSFYKQTRMELYKERSPTVRIIAESDKEKEVKKRRWEKVGGPSPFAYNSA